MEHAEVLATSRRGNGKQRVLKIVRDGKPYVYKCYGAKRGFWRIVAREFGSRLIVGKSSILPGARLRTEQEVLQLWAAEGFDVPKVISPAPPSSLIQPCLCLEWIPGTSLAKVLRSPAVRIERKVELMERFAAVLGQRHDRALTNREPRLLFENPTFEHILLSGDRLVHFDFEIVFTRKSDLSRLARREIIGFLSGLPREEKELALLLDRFVAAYPDRELLKKTKMDLLRHGGVPMRRMFTAFHLLAKNGERYRNRLWLARALDAAMTRCGAPIAPPPAGMPA